MPKMPSRIGCTDKHIVAYQLFVDYTQVFGSVSQEQMMKTLEKYILARIRRMLAMT